MDTTIVIANDTNSTMNNSEPAKKTGLGARLKAARETMQLTEKEAATRLHLNTNIISIIENENFANGPPATFIRGYLRSYARLLNISENEIKLTLQELESAIPSSSTIIPALPQMQPIHYSERHLHWLTYLIVLILIILVSLWWRSHSRYAITDTPSKPLVQSTAPSLSIAAAPTPAEKPAITPMAPVELNPAITPPSHKTIKPTALPTMKPSVKVRAPSSPLANMVMALPEPEVESPN